MLLIHTLSASLPLQLTNYGDRKNWSTTSDGVLCTYQMPITLVVTTRYEGQRSHMSLLGTNHSVYCQECSKYVFQNLQSKPQMPPLPPSAGDWQRGTPGKEARREVGRASFPGVPRLKEGHRKAGNWWQWAIWQTSGSIAEEGDLFNVLGNCCY